MSVITRHAAYLEAAETWMALRTAYNGSGPVKAAGTRYLPRPAGMRRQEQYNAYRGRAIWLGATERAVLGLTGAIFRRDPQVVVPSALEAHLADITLTGMPFLRFAERLVRETLLMGRAGVLVDFPAPIALLDGGLAAPALGSRPYWVLWEPEAILNWRTDLREDMTVLALVVLKESVVAPSGIFPSADFFLDRTVTQYRVLRLNEAGQYEVSLWRERAGAPRAGSQPPVVDLVAQWVPQRAGEPLSFIPFLFVAPFSLEPAVEKSLLEALVEINYQHYRHSADYEHGLHLTALPTPYITGYAPENATLEIGSTAAWAIPSPEARVGMLEFQGQGLQSHERALETDIKNMAALGARLVESAPHIAETATSVRQRTEGSDSPLQTLISNASAALTKALQVHAWWAGFTEQVADDTILAQLNKDLLAVTMDARVLRELVTTWLSGGISYQTLYENLRKGEITRTGVASEDEQELIALEVEARGMALGTQRNLTDEGDLGDGR